MTDLPQYRNLIGGQIKDAASRRLLGSVNPATGEVWAKVALSDRSDADEAVAAAKAAFPAWSALPPDERSLYLKRVGDLFTGQPGRSTSCRGWATSARPWFVTWTWPRSP